MQTAISRYSFSNFRASSVNREAFQTIKDIASGKISGKPVFLSGATFSGKTHLLKALKVVAEKGKKVLYETEEAFLDDLFDFYKFNKLDVWAETKYGDSDIILIDDLYSLHKKSKTQEALVALLSWSLENGRTVILSSVLELSRFEVVRKYFESEQGMRNYELKLTANS